MCAEECVDWEPTFEDFKIIYLVPQIESSDLIKDGFPVSEWALAREHVSLWRQSVII